MRCDRTVANLSFQFLLQKEHSAVAISRLSSSVDFLSAACAQLSDAVALLRADVSALNSFADEYMVAIV
jgi:outer membrane murein-binding lipoprotein Lpp